jgi:uncharacterized protein (TIGR02599 family)
MVVRPKQNVGTATVAAANPSYPFSASPWSYYTSPWAYFDYPYDSSIGWKSGSGSYSQPVTQNQLPPVVELTLIALDDANGRKLEQMTGGNSVSKLSLTSSFGDPTNQTYNTGLDSITSYLSTNKILYRTFVTDVVLESAEW